MNSYPTGEKIFFNSDEYRLCGIYNAHIGKIHGNVILIHGIINDKDEDNNFVELALELNKKGYNTFRFDFRGHGESEGKSEDVTIAGEVHDLENSMCIFKQKTNNPFKFTFIASSFGAVASILYISRNNNDIQKLVLWNPVLDFDRTFLNAETAWGKTIFNEKGYLELRQKGFISIPETDFRFGKKLIDEFKAIKPYKFLRTFDIPVLTIHGTEDTAVPYSVSKKFGKPNDKSEFISHKSDHCFVGIEDIVIKETVDWIVENDIK